MNDNISIEYAVVFLVTESGRVIGQLRDNKPSIDNPGKVAAFGGAIENNETPEQAAMRELGEETNLSTQDLKLIKVGQLKNIRKLTGQTQIGHFFYTFIVENDLKNLQVFEGQGWTEINGTDDTRVLSEWRGIYIKLYAEINNKNFTDFREN